MSDYSSNLAVYINGLVSQKKALGYSYTYGERVLQLFDTFCREKYPEEVTITRTMGLDWTTRLPGEKKSISTAKRMAPVRELGKYMLRKGVEAYIIPNEFVKQPSARYMPHIFTDDELSRLFHEMDVIENHIHPNSFEQYVMPVLFRLIYSCGLRPQEGRLVKRCDIDLEGGVLFIPESKRHKDRYVPLSPGMLTLCQKYSKIIAEMAPENEYFFPSGARSHYQPVSIEANFKRYCVRAGISQEMNGNAPRIYDLRHTFATKRLYQWMKAGRDLDACIPFLSTYMGHAHLSQTAYYIHLVPEIFPTLTEIDWNRFSSILPEVNE